MKLRPCSGRLLSTALLLIGLFGLPPGAPAQEAGSEPAVLPAVARVQLPHLALPDGLPLDPQAATRAYLDTVSAEAKERSDAYFEGGYWLQLVSFVYGAAVALLLLARRWSAALRDRAERITRRKPLQTCLYWFQYAALTGVLYLPLSVYLGFVREHQYGLATQTFAEWLLDWTKSLGVEMVMGGILMVFLYGVLRRARNTWWLWGSVVFVLFVAFQMLVFPVFVAPLFNTYAKLEDPEIRGPILRLARANGIAVDAVYQVDASRQSTRISANVSGFLGTQRINLNDNLLKRCSLPEIEAVMAHEMGHYVLNHMPEMLLSFGLIIVVGFGFVRWAFGRVVARRGEAWGLRGGIDDLAALPLAGLLLSVYFLAMTPVVNTVIRTNEAEADLFGLNAARQPDAFAQVALKLGDYRKLDPGPWEEWIFFDHPSGRSRILMAMRWKAENQPPQQP